MPKVSDDLLAARREEILNATRKAFTQLGYDKATVRRLEEYTGISRGTIFHHFKDKDALFLAVAQADVKRMSDVVAESGLVQVMRNMIDSPTQYDWLSTRLEITRKIRTDTVFRSQWESQYAMFSQVALERLEQRKKAGRIRDDISPEILVEFLELFFEGLISRIAIGFDTKRADILRSVVTMVETSVRPQEKVNNLG